LNETLEVLFNGLVIIIVSSMSGYWA